MSWKDITWHRNNSFIRLVDEDEDENEDMIMILINSKKLGYQLKCSIVMIFYK